MQYIPDEDVLYHVMFEGDGPNFDSIVPFAWHVYVLRDLAVLQRLREERGGWHDGDDVERLAYAWTTMRRTADEDTSIGVMYFVQGWVYVGMVAHEALHLASWMCRYTEENRRFTLGYEPERMAEITGQLTSVVWYNLEKDGMATVDAPGDPA